MKKGAHKVKMKDLVRKLSGIQTIESIRSRLKIDRNKAIYLVYRLRKKGYVLTKQDSDNSRIYFISKENVWGGKSYVDILNEHSPIKLSSSEVYKIYGRDISIEETIVYAIKTHSLRYILSSLALFKRINNWSELYRLAKKNNIVREIGALYTLVEVNFPKIKKINKKFLNLALPTNKGEFRYIIQNLRSKDFYPIEKMWRIYIPFNKRDLAEYRS